jgi:hypothetical protein
MSRKLWIIGILALIIMLSLGTFFYRNSIKHDNSTETTISVTPTVSLEPSSSIIPIAVKSSSSQTAPLNIIYNRNVFISNGWTIFRNENDEMKLYKIKSDGSGLTKIVDKSLSLILVDGDTIYYTLDQSHDLYKTSLTDEHQTIKLIDNSILPVFSKQSNL